MELYNEPPEAGNAFRKTMFAEVQALLRHEQQKADRRRKRCFLPEFSSVDSYEQSVSEYRGPLRAMLGWPLTDNRARNVPSVLNQNIGRDSLGRISRILIETLPGVHTYGLFFRPMGRGPFPLVISQHGGGGTPEACSSLTSPHGGNYNDMTRRVLKMGIAVFAPQLLLWQSENFGPKFEIAVIDRRLKQIGGSLAALDLYRIFRSLDYFTTRKDIDAERVGMIGLSYGGFYTLYAAALDTRIKVAVSSCFFKIQERREFPALMWSGAASRFFDTEVGAMVCPRSLYIEWGKKDSHFDARCARPEASKLAGIYRRLGLAERFRYKEHPGTHELDKADDGIEFLCRHLEVKGSANPRASEHHLKPPEAGHAKPEVRRRNS